MYNLYKYNHYFPHLLSRVVYFILGRHYVGSFRSWVLALSTIMKTMGSVSGFDCSLKPHSSCHHQLIMSTYTPDDRRCIKFNHSY